MINRSDMKTEWKPINPCKNCDARKIGCETFCRVLSEYKHEVSAQKKLLEYQLAHSTGNVVTLRELESMLKELESKK
jgi:hypothetical protein